MKFGIIEQGARYLTPYSLSGMDMGNTFTGQSHRIAPTVWSIPVPIYFAGIIHDCS